MGEMRTAAARLRQSTGRVLLAVREYVKDPTPITFEKLDAAWRDRETASLAVDAERRRSGW